jgi:hypothetical protein
LYSNSEKTLNASSRRGIVSTVGLPNEILIASHIFSFFGGFHFIANTS